VTASRFSRVATCAHCGSTVHLDDGVLSVARFREAYRAWNTPTGGSGREQVTLAGSGWTLLAHLAHGESSEVYAAERARHPTERAIFKRLRDDGDVPLFEQEWRVLEQLAAADGATEMGGRIPQPIARGRLGDGAHAMTLRWTHGFDHTFEHVRGAYPRGVEPAIAVWMWRRILETLAFVHRAGLVHGAVVPPHLLVQRGEHGVRLVGFSCAAAAGAPLLAVNERYAAYYPASLVLSPASDLTMAARCIAFVLGAGDDGRVPAGVPGPLGAVVAAAITGDAPADAWVQRERVGEVARSLFGPARFHPLKLS
jgi:hypothetical protein